MGKSKFGRGLQTQAKQRPCRCFVSSSTLSAFWISTFQPALPAIYILSFFHVDGCYHLSMTITMFTATRTQAATYLLGVCLFSISFLVFLNSSISFVITDILRRNHGIGDAVGTLGFADELVVLVACPVWGLLSDRIGFRTVCILAYCTSTRGF